MIRVRVLGASEIWIGHRRIGMNTEVLFALALYLTTRAGEWLARADLLELFWTKGSGEQRRHALRQLLYRLRQKGFTLDEDGEAIYLDPARVESDLRDALGDQWVEHASAGSIDAAATLTMQFSRRIAPGFLEWFDGVRDRLALQHRRASAAQIVLARREGRWNDLERWAQSVLRSDPLNEEATLARAESAAMAGSKTIALEILDNYLQEVGEVAPELGRPAALLRKRIAERRPDWATRGPKEVALIGRTELMSRLTGLVDAAWRGEGSAVILTGAPGIGKTRLAMEARAYAELKGMRTVLVRAEAANVERPLAVVQELIELFLELPGVAGCDPESLRLVRKVVGRRREASHRDAAAFMTSVREYLLNAMRDLLDAIVHECRVMVVVDDYHHVDEASHGVLRALMIATSQSRILWTGSMRSGGRGLAFSKSIEGGIPVIRVDGLSDSASRLLASATSEAHDCAVSEAVLSSVASASAGNPLFVRELSLSRGRHPTSSALPETLSHLINERLERLPVFHLRILRVVALLGSDSTPSRIHAIVGGERGTLTQAIEEVEADGLLHVTSAKTFALHECWQQALLDSTKAATRTSLSHECALALVEETGFDASPQTLWRAAELFVDAGAANRAVPLYEIAAEQLFAAGLPHESASVLQRTVAIVASQSDRIRVLSRLAVVSMAAGDPARAIQVSGEALSGGHLHRGSAGVEIAACLCARADALMRLNEEVFTELRALTELASDTSLAPQARLQVCLTGIRVALYQGRTADIEHFFRESRSVALEYGKSTASELTAIVYLTEMGPHPELIEVDRTLSLLVRDELSVYRRCMVHRFRCFSLRVRGCVEDAIVTGERAYELARSHSLYHDAYLAAEVLAFLYLDQTDYNRASASVANLRELRAHTTYTEQAVALGHASDRLLMQLGQFSRVANRLNGRIDSIRTHRGIENRSGELATLAYCLAQSGRERDAERILLEVTEAVSLIRSRFVADYTVELASRTLRLLSADAEADRLADAHLREQLRKFPRSFPPFYTELRAGLDRLATRSN